MTIDAITPGARVLCAVSGGVDSIYLLHRMTELAAQRGFTVGCAHFNHGLRGTESDRDEAFVRTQCAHLGVPFYAGHGDVQVENRIEGDFRGLVFTTGVMKMAESEVCKNDNVIAAFGRDFPENDTVKWERESVGLAVAVPQRQIVSQTDDKTSYLFQLTPDARGRIDYAFEMIWRKSEWLKDRSDTECVLGLMESVGAARTPVVVSRIRQF